MHYHQYYPIDVVNGPGTRSTLFVAGCEHHCRGCYNQTTWRVDSGLLFTQAMEDRIISDLQDTSIPRRGLTLSGGDPLHPHNVPSVLKLVKRVRAECPGKDIWMWTGYTVDELTDAQLEVVECVNHIIDGKYIEALRDPALQWRGSSNQQIYRIHERCFYNVTEELTKCKRSSS